MKEIKIIRYCPNCADQGVSVSEGVNGSDFVECEKCDLSVNIFWPEVEECGNCGREATQSAGGVNRCERCVEL